jgi:hypothetical protein
MVRLSRRLFMTRGGLALLSLVWIVAVYALWRGFQSPDATKLNMALAQCSRLESYFPYAYAECLRFARDARVNSEAQVAGAATLLALLPVAFLWLCWLGRLLLRECGTTMASPAPRSSHYL